MEFTKPESQALIRSVTDRIRKRKWWHAKVSDLEKIVSEVDLLVTETNSGASFEQYFRWARLEGIRRIVGHIELLGLTDLAKLVERAISVAFPGGIPESYEEKDELTDWADSTERELHELAKEFLDESGRLENRLADFYRSESTNSSEPTGWRRWLNWLS